MTDIHAEQRIDLLVDHDVDKIKKKNKTHIAPGMRKHTTKVCDSIDAQLEAHVATNGSAIVIIAVNRELQLTN